MTDNNKPRPDFWPQQNGEWYINSCRYINYPENPLSGIFDKIIRAEDTVLDLGCGFGLSSVSLAKRCQRVIAADPSESAIAWLRAYCAEQGIDRVQPIAAGLGQQDGLIPRCDVSITLYVDRLIGNRSRAERLLELTGREGIVMLHFAEDSYGIQQRLRDALGIKDSRHTCRNGCYVMGIFESLGCRCDCSYIEHDFGQPVRDFEDGIEFMRYMLRLEDSMLPHLREIAADYMEEREGTLYIPNIRRSCVVHFIK